jgi:hypothetical protein
VAVIEQDAEQANVFYLGNCRACKADTENPPMIPSDFLARARRVLTECAQMRADAAHWNRINPSARPINLDADGRLRNTERTMVDFITKHTGEARPTELGPQTAVGAAVLFCIYFNPLDYPGHYVAREWRYNGSLWYPMDPPLAVSTQLGAVRAVIPMGWQHVERHADDDVAILETWIAPAFS